MFIKLAYTTSLFCLFFLKTLKIKATLIMNAGITKTSLMVLTVSTSYSKNTIERKIIIVEMINPVFI
ncbi:hypothetical protein [Algibacter lectus]|nr:hypothetical protein [Algibacter lectus]